MDTEQLYTQTADIILEKLDAVETKIDQLLKQKEQYREVLATFRQDGTVNDTLEYQGTKWKWQKTSTTWKYSQALIAEIKNKQAMEKAEGIATASIKYSWKRYPRKLEF